jgi:hypothetical protein
MCLAIYVGTTVELPLVAWTDRPAFHVDALEGHREVRRRIDRPFLYDVGAHTGCACGFVEPAPSDDEHASWSTSIDAFSEWLRGAVDGGPIEVLVCWMGDESKKATRRTVGLDTVRDVDFDAAWNQPIRLRVHA